MILPQQYNLSVYKNATYEKVFVCTNSDGTVFDFTDLTVESEIRPINNSETLLAAFDCDTNVETGTVTLSLTAEQTEAMNPGSYVWDLKLTNNEGIQAYLLYGNVTVWGRVTA